MDLSQVFVAVAAGVILGALGFGLTVKSSLTRIEVILTGANGENGLVGDMKQQRERTHALANDVNTIRGTQALHELRLDEWDRRQGPEDRRVAS